MLLGRSKDVIITGGLNVYPKEVEDQLDQFDEVEESAVIGIKSYWWLKKLDAIQVYPTRTSAKQSWA